MITTPDSAFCRQCGYRLYGLPEHRCPECGSDFDPDDPKTMRTGARWTAVVGFLTRAARTFMLAGGLFVLAPAIVWLATFQLSPILAMIVAALIAGYLIWGRHLAALAMLVLMSPVSVAGLLNARAYAAGEMPYVRSSPRDYLHRPAASIHPVTRCIRFDLRGGTRDRRAWSTLKESSMRPVERAMYRLTGPPSSAYTGPYPGEAEAIELVRSASPVQADSFMSHVITIVVDGHRIQLKDVRHTSRYYPAPIMGPEREPDYEPILGTVVSETCLILRTPRGMRGDGHPARVALIDLATGEQFALYFDDAPLDRP